MFIFVLMAALLSIAQFFNSICRTNLFTTAAIGAQVRIYTIYIIAFAYRLGWTFINTTPTADTLASNYMRHFYSLLFARVTGSPQFKLLALQLNKASIMPSSDIMIFF
jgi:hypothetical protein